MKDPLLNASLSCFKGPESGHLDRLLFDLQCPSSSFLWVSFLRPASVFLQELQTKTRVDASMERIQQSFYFLGLFFDSPSKKCQKLHTSAGGDPGVIQLPRRRSSAWSVPPAQNTSQESIFLRRFSGYTSDRSFSGHKAPQGCKVRTAAAAMRNGRRSFAQSRVCTYFSCLSLL